MPLESHAFQCHVSGLAVAMDARVAVGREHKLSVTAIGAHSLYNG